MSALNGLARARPGFDAETVEAIATRVAELVLERLEPSGVSGRTLVGVDAVAEHLGVDRGWVYEHADQLGVRRLGNGSKPRLRFSLSEVDQKLATCSPSRRSEGSASDVTKPIGRRRRARRLGTTAPLLPIRGLSSPREAAHAAQNQARDG